MRAHHIVELSASAGLTAEGFAFGGVGASLFAAAYKPSTVSDVVYAYVRDRTTGATSFVDVGARLDGSAVSPAAVLPWNSAGDALIVAGDHEVSEILLRVSVAGVGAWNTLEVYDSTDGIRFNRLRTVSSDGTNALKTAGIGRIVLAPVTGASASMTPVPDEVPARRWYALVPVGMTTAPATAPEIDRAWLKHALRVEHSEVASALNATVSDGTFAGAAATVLVVEGEGSIYVLPGPALGIDWTTHRSTDANNTTTFEYLASNNTYQPLPSFVDSTAGFTVGPVALGGATVRGTWRWAIPSDWDSKTITPDNVQSPGSASATGYAIRARTTAVTGARVVRQALVRARVRAFGAGNVTGITESTAVTFRRVQFSRIGLQSGAALVAEVVNMTSGRGVTVTIPAGYEIGDMLDLSAPLAIGAGEQWDIRYVSGGRIDDADLHVSEV